MKITITRLIRLFLMQYSSLLHWSDRRVAWSGRFVIVFMLVAGAAGVDTTLSMIYQVFALLAGLVVASFLSVLFMRRRRYTGLVVHSRFPRYASVGEDFEYSVSIRNPGARLFPAATLYENPEDPRPSPAEFVSLMEGFAFLRKEWWTRAFDLILFQSALPKMKPVEIPPFDAGTTHTVKMSAKAGRRGIYFLPGIVMAYREPLGLLRKVVPYACPRSLIVLPRRYPVGRPALPGVERYHQGGVSQASHIGETGEFVGLRDYQPGDPVRRIHWRSWAKAGKPVVREHMEEYFVRHALILDTFATGSQTRAFEAAVSLSASLACHILTRESLLDMMFIENRAYSFTAGRGLMQTDKMLEILASVKSAPQRHFPLLGELILSKAHLLCGAICIFLDWDEPRRKIAESLSSRGIPLKVLLVKDTDPALLERAPMGAFPEHLHVIRPDHPAEDILKV